MSGHAHAIRGTGDAATAKRRRCGSSALVTGICVLACGTIGGFVPELWGASAFGLTSLAFSAIGSVAGVFLGARIASF